MNPVPKEYFLNHVELNNGMKLCFNKAKRLLNDANLLVDNGGDSSHALGLYILALEEYGKGLLLRDCKKNAERNYVVPTYIFGGKSSHENKIKKALDALPHNCNIGIAVTVNEAPDSIRTITLKGDKNIISIYDWSTGNFSSTADSIQEDTRWRCFYVDWYDKERYWKYEFFVADKDLFSNAMSVLIKNISQECRVST